MEEAAPVVEAVQVCSRHHGRPGLTGAEGQLAEVEGAARSPCSLAVYKAGIRDEGARRHSGRDTARSWRRCPWGGRQGLGDMVDSRHRQMR